MKEPKVLIGTCSWTDPTLLESGWYPEKVAKKADERLRFYAERFSLVENDASYYALPDQKQATLWVERTPDDFTMNVKAFRLFTGHPTSPTVLAKDIRAALPPSGKAKLYLRDVPGEIVDELWRRFIEALMPLRVASKLGLVHFQFPPWLLRNAEGHAHVRMCVERMAGHTLSVEFRQQSWFADERAVASTLAFERELGVVHTVVDGPQGFANSVPALWEVTHPHYALLRLHGRNVETWNIKGASDSSERFNYDYPEAELNELAQKVKRIAAQALSTHVVFNNNMEDQGQRNAASLSAFLKS